MKKHLCFYALLATLLLPVTGKALDPVRSRQLWLWFQVSKQLPKKFTVGVQYQVRLGNNMSNFTGENFYGIVGYKINKYLSAEVVYQFYTSRKINNHTFFADLYAKYSYHKFTIGYRCAYQYITEYFNSEYQYGHEPVHEWRNRIVLKYKLPENFSVYAYCEPYLTFLPRLNAQGTYVSKIRNLVGINWGYNKYNTATLFYIFQPEFASKKPQYQHVLGIIYELDMPKKVSWKKLYRPSWVKKKGKKDKDDGDNDNDRLFE